MINGQNIHFKHSYFNFFFIIVIEEIIYDKLC